MNKTDFFRLAELIKSLYPKEEKLFSTKQSSDMWYEMLKDLNFEKAVYGVQKYAKSNTFPPSIADIRKYSEPQKNPAEWIDVYQYAIRMISRYGSYRESECMAALDPVTEWIVKHIGYKRICMSPENDYRIKQEFKELYEESENSEIADMEIETRCATEPILRIT